jgi:hypothetical protein
VLMYCRHCSAVVKPRYSALPDTTESFIGSSVCDRYRYLELGRMIGPYRIRRQGRSSRRTLFLYIASLTLLVLSPLFIIFRFVNEFSSLRHKGFIYKGTFFFFESYIYLQSVMIQLPVVA